MGAHAVFAGHDHHYERLAVSGLPYFVVGTGGAGLRSARAISETRTIATNTHGLLRLEGSEAQLKISFVSANDAVLDRLVLGCAGQAATPAPVGNARVWLPAVRQR